MPVKKIQKGFTLVELLVTMTILVVLTTGVLSAFTNSRMSARDAKRRADLVALQQAFEQYFAVNGEYVSTVCTDMDGALQGSYPADPVGTAGGWEEYTENCTDTDYYCVCARLERDNSGNSEDTACAFDDPTTTGDLDWFCVESRQ